MDICWPGQHCFWRRLCCFFPRLPSPDRVSVGITKFSFLLFLTNKTSVTMQVVGWWHKYDNFFFGVTVSCYLFSCHRTLWDSNLKFLNRSCEVRSDDQACFYGHMLSVHFPNLTSQKKIFMSVILDFTDKYCFSVWCYWFYLWQVLRNHRISRVGRNP